MNTLVKTKCIVDTIKEMAKENIYYAEEEIDALVQAMKIEEVRKELGDFWKMYDDVAKNTIRGFVLEEKCLPVWYVVYTIDVKSINNPAWYTLYSGKYMFGDAKEKQNFTLIKESKNYEEVQRAMFSWLMYDMYIMLIQ